MPDFLIIGAQKAGTTWLFQNLRVHPEIWFPPEKEIHYFDLPPFLPFSWLRFMPLRAIRTWALNRLDRDRAKVARGEQSSEWFQKYYEQWRTARWYESIFTPAPGQIAGEATPTYATLSERRIRQIQRRMPDLKLIYLLRDPLARMWSDVAMFHTAKFGGTGLESANEKAVMHFLKSRWNLGHSRYFENLSRWEKYFEPSRIFVGFQDHISEDPLGLLKQVFQFLGVDGKIEVSQELAQRRINVAHYPAMPTSIGRYLAEQLIVDLENLDRRFQNTHTASWMRRAQALLQTH
ncbi:MAG: sulfotransferase domain-containing protein [Ramlibacter sp.]